MIILQHVCSRPRRVPVLVWPPVKGFGSSGPVFRFALSNEEGTAVLQSLRFRRMIQYQHHRMHVCANSSRYAVSSVSTLVGECTTETNIVQADSEIPYFKVGVAIAFEYDADRRSESGRSLRRWVVTGGLAQGQRRSKVEGRDLGGRTLGLATRFLPPNRSSSLAIVPEIVLVLNL